MIEDRLARDPEMQDVVLIFSAVNEVDFSALESLEAINHLLKDRGIGLHLSEVKGPVEDRLWRSHFLQELNWQVYLSHYEAWRAPAGAGSDPAASVASQRASQSASKPSHNVHNILLFKL